MILIFTVFEDLREYKFQRLEYVVLKDLDEKEAYKRGSHCLIKRIRFSLRILDGLRLMLKR